MAGALLRGLSRADSLTLDPHKGMFLPYGTGALLVRDGAALRAAHEATADYLPAMPHPDDFYDPSQHGPDLSRGFPGLRVWLTREAVRGRGLSRRDRGEARAGARRRSSAYRALPGIVIDAPPELSLFAFHVTWPGATLARGGRRDPTIDGRDDGARPRDGDRRGRARPLSRPRVRAQLPHARRTRSTRWSRTWGGIWRCRSR